MEFVHTLLAQLEQTLEQIRETAGDNICLANRSTTAVVAVISQLKDYIRSYEFADAEEEICFFKTLKPKFSSLLIFYVKMQQIETRRPNGSHAAQCEYLSKELDRLKHFFDNNLSFYQYIRTGATHLDEKFFTRKPFDTHLNLDPFVFDMDTEFSTSHDYKVSRLIANEMLEGYLKQALEDTQCAQSKPSKAAPCKNKLSWTGSKAALIELLYGLQSAGTFNNANAEIKQIAAYFESVFDVDLGNFYRTFQEIRIRKKNRTSFLDTLKNCLINKMDEIDECPNASLGNHFSYRKAG